ncbi:hypothetical protein [Sphingomonas sp.]|uniref:hypothetical protein n=1 Tax=Sphingomonas sp. TaxID=28214 RepID=UPI003B3BD4B6
MTTGVPLLPLRRWRPTSFALLIAATCLPMLLAAALALSLRAAAEAVSDTAREHILVQVVEPVPERREQLAGAVLTRLDRVEGIVSVRRVQDQEAEALVAPYIEGMKAHDLPLPALIEVHARSREPVARALRALPAVQVTAAGAELGPLARLIGALRAVAFGVALICAAATGVIAMLSARAALAREGTTLDILHALGATDGQMSQLVSNAVTRDAAVGATGGLVVATIVIVMVGHRISALGAGIDPNLGVAGWATLVALAAALVGLAMLAAQATLLVNWRRMP